jgi:hypothetical protein
MKNIKEKLHFKKISYFLFNLTILLADSFESFAITFSSEQKETNYKHKKYD